MGIPNILSIFRLVLAPVFVVVYFSGLDNARIYAAIIYIMASITDVLDGMIARRYNITSELGKLLDPLGDKVMTFTVLICITIDRVIPVWVVIVFAAKEALMGIGGLILHKKISSIPPSNYLGKAATVVFFIVCTVLMLFPQVSSHTVTVMVTAAIAMMLLAFFRYIATFTKMVKKGEKEA